MCGLFGVSMTEWPVKETDLDASPCKRWATLCSVPVTLAGGWAEETWRVFKWEWHKPIYTWRQSLWRGEWTVGESGVREALLSWSHCSERDLSSGMSIGVAIVRQVSHRWKHFCGMAWELIGWAGGNMGLAYTETKRGWFGASWLSWLLGAPRCSWKLNPMWGCGWGKVRTWVGRNLLGHVPAMGLPISWVLDQPWEAADPILWPLHERGFGVVEGMGVCHGEALFTRRVFKRKNYGGSNHLPEVLGFIWCLIHHGAR